MAVVVITLRIMPSGPDADLNSIERKAKELIVGFAGHTQFKIEIKPIAFGIKSVDVTFVMEENLGSTENLEGQISKIEEVNSVEVTDVRRALG